MNPASAPAHDTVVNLPEILSGGAFKDSLILELLPAAVYVCDKEGRITSHNRKATELWGRTPNKNDRDELFSGSFKLYHTDGRPMPPNETPMAATLADGLPREGLELIVERPDLSQRTIRANVVPVKDEKGTVLGLVNCFYDITEEKKLHRELEWKQKQLQDYAENAVIGLHWVDDQGIIKWANKAELAMLGYSRDEYIGEHISRFHVDQRKADDILNRLAAGETLNGYEASFRCKDGSVKTVQISSNVFREEGKFIHTRCFTIDVTQQKRLFQALKESETRYRSLIENLETPLYTTDAEGNITLYNRAAVSLWGREPEIKKDKWCGSYKIFNPDGSDLPLDQCPMAVCLREKRAVHGEEIIVARPDGTMRTVAPHPQPLFDEEGALLGAINMLVDITDFKQTEKALRDSEAKYRELAASLEKKIDEKTTDLIHKNEELKKSEERYHKMVEEVEDYAIILLDSNGVIRNWNKGAEKIKGYKEDEIIGQSFEVFYRQEDRLINLPRMLIEQAKQTGKAIHEGWRVRKDGSLFWGSTVLTALHNVSGEVIGFTKVTRELTAKKIAEDKMREYTSQLEFQNQELEQFAYAASHDLKEPLRKIHLYNSSVLENPSNHLDEKSREYLNRSVRATKRMTELIEGLLAYSRTTGNEESFEQIDLEEVIDEIVLMHKDEFEQKKARIEYKKLSPVMGIPFQIKQLMSNLLGNSIKYKHPDRDVRIQIITEKASRAELQEAGLDTQRPYRKISVMDNGVGFDPEHAEKIFDIFQRLNNLPGAQGSGIGLAICKKIVQNHKGHIAATAKAYEGARFDVFLPAVSF